MQTTEFIDTHLHIWDLKRVHYHWLSPGDPLYRDCLPDEVYPQMQDAGVGAAVLVEAANTTAEIAFLAEQTERYPWIRGVIGWMSAQDQLTDDLHPKVRGVRIPHLELPGTPILPKVVASQRLTCDLLLNPYVYPKAATLAQTWPDIAFVLDHFAGVRLTPGGHKLWREHVKVLAACPNTVLKISGYVTAADPRPLAFETLRAYVMSAVEIFGASRVLWGSDWPICTQAGPYAQTVEMLRTALVDLSPEEQTQIMSGTAKRIYSL